MARMDEPDWSAFYDVDPPSSMVENMWCGFCLGAWRLQGVDAQGQHISSRR